MDGCRGIIIISFFKTVNLFYRDSKSLLISHSLVFRDLCILEVIPLDSTAERIFALLKAQGVEQKEFAVLVGTTDKTVSAWKNGRSKSYTKNLTQIASILGTSVEYLVTGEKKEPATGSGDGFADKLSEALKGIGIDVDNLTDAEINRIARLAKAALEE